jgi:Tfp pilus assembly protein PilZ
MARGSNRESMIGWTVSLEDASGTLHTCDLCDVTSDGLFISPQSGAHGFDAGQRVRILIRTGGVQLHVGGEVRWVGPSDTHEVEGFGVKLDNIPNPVASALGIGQRGRTARLAS